MEKHHRTTEECFKHFARDAHNFERRKAVAKFAQVVMEPTVRKWFTDRFTASGEKLIKVRFFLDLLGYKVEEIENMDPVFQNLARLFAFDIISFDDVVAICGYEGENARDQTMRVLTGKIGMYADRYQKVYSEVREMAELIEHHRKELLQKYAAYKLPETNGATGPSEGQPAPIAAALPHMSAATPRLSAHEQVIRSLAHQVEAMLPLADLLLSDQFSAKERARLRELTGSDGVFKLSNRLNALCGEKAREKIQH